MKKIRTIVAILFLALILGGMSSCETTRHGDEGRHRGWFHRHDDDHHDRGGVIIVDPDHR